MKQPGTCMICSRPGAEQQDGIERVIHWDGNTKVDVEVTVPIWVCSCGFSWTENASYKKAIKSHMETLGYKTTKPKRSETMGSKKKNPSKTPVVTVTELIRTELTDGGFDGLISASGSCCCYLDNGTCPCNEVTDECIAGNIILETCDVRKIGPISIGPLSVKAPWEIVTTAKK